MDNVGDTKIETGTYNVEATTDSKYQDYVLESIIPAEADIAQTDRETNATFKVKVTPRSGKSPANGNLYFKLTPTYSGSEDISFIGTVQAGEADNKFVANPDGMPYVAGNRADGLETVEAVANITSSGATLEVGVFGFKVTNKSAIINFIKAISVEYAWVDKAS